MKFYRFLTWLACTQFWTIFGNAEYEALAVTKSEVEFHFARPALNLIPGDFGEYRYLLTKGEPILYYLCPAKFEINGPIVLTEAARIVNFRGDQKEICRTKIKPKMFRVLGTWENDQGERNIIVYHIGFEIDVENFHGIIRYPKYESMDLNSYLMPMVVIYYHENLEYVLAVRYKSIGADVPTKPVDYKEYSLEESLYVHAKFKEFYEQVEDKLRKSFDTDFDEKRHELVLGSLINENDFLIDVWKASAKYMSTPVLIWKELYENWLNIEEFIRFVAWRGEAGTEITAGVGKMLTIQNNDGREYEMEWNKGINGVFIPELYWKAIKFRNKSGLVSGLFVIMHNDPFTESSKITKICPQNLCVREEIWLTTKDFSKINGLIYCCPIDDETIEKLGVKFLFKKLTPFDEIKKYKFSLDWTRRE